MQYKLVIKDIGTKVSVVLFKKRKIFGWRKVRRHTIVSSDLSFCKYNINIWSNQYNLSSENTFNHSKLLNSQI